MKELSKVLAENPTVVTSLVILITFVVCSIILTYLVAFFQGREISIWQIKIGKKDTKSDKNKTSDDNTKANYDYRNSIKDCFILFKNCVNIYLNQTIRFRLHFLKYNRIEDKLTMSIQDDVYEDRNTEITIEEGCQKGVVICKALKINGLKSENLSSEHYVKYPDSPIRKSLRSVMAFPVKNVEGNIVGVVSLDSDEEFKNIGIEQHKLEDIFLKLCKTIENILKTRSEVL